MNSRSAILLAATLLFGATAVLAAPKAKPAKPSAIAAAGQPKTRPMTLTEARAAIDLLDDAYQTELHEVHMWYPIKTGQPVVAATLVRKVQEQMVAKGWPASRFLAVNATPMNPKHVPQDSFEKDAVEQIKGGAERVERVESGHLRVATLVPLTGGCASCHWVAGKESSKGAIVWNIPLK